MHGDVSNSGQSYEHAADWPLRLAQADQATVDRVVFGQTPAHMMAGDPWAATVARRIGECFAVRDYLATFAITEEGARRALGVSLALARMQSEKGEGAAAALTAGAWCAAGLGRWSFAEVLAQHALRAVDGYVLAETIRDAIERLRFEECVGVEPTISVETIRFVAARTLQRLCRP